MTEIVNLGQGSDFDHERRSAEGNAAEEQVVVLCPGVG